MASKKAKRGKKREMVVTSETLGPEIRDSFLPDDEPAAAKLGVAKAPLEWRQERDPDNQPAKLWRARRPDGVTYTVEEDERGWCCEVDGVEDLGDPQSTLEAAQALCQWHADTELPPWKLGDRVWTADTAERHIDPDDGDDLGPVVYAIEPSDDGERFFCSLYTEPVQTIGDEPATSLEEAQERCQAHYREQYPPPQADPAEATQPDAKPARELGDWMIGRPPTVEVRAGLSLKQAEGSEEIEELRIELDIAERAFKATRKRIEKEIHEIEQRMLKLASEVRHGMSAKVRCWRERVNGEWLYTDEAGAELYREPAETPLPAGAQQKLVGDRTVPKDPPPDDDEPDPPPATEPHPEPEAEPDPPAPTGELPPAGESLTWTSATGEYGREYLTGGEREGYTISRDPGTQTKAGKGGLLQIVYHSRALPGAMVIRKLNGRHKKVEAAKGAAQKDNDTRLRWPAEWYGVTKLEARGQYQLTQLGSGMVLAIRVGNLDEETTELGEHPDEQQAQQACQTDADRRAEG